jgi:DNA-binding HxlR family transcriptional regulator
LFFTTINLQNNLLKWPKRTQRSRLRGMVAVKVDGAPSWRRYRDACGAAQGLDLVGERWTLLVVRELLLGPKRFTDLRAGLPGISSNILADRLETLEVSGVARRRTLPPPAGSKVYELTDWGEELGPVVEAIGRWGARSPWRDEEDGIGVDALVVSFRTMFDPEAADGLEASYELVLENQAFGLKIEDGSIRVYRGAPDNPDARIETDVHTLATLVYDGGDLDAAIRCGDAEIGGDRSAMDRLLGLFPLPEPAPKPAGPWQG